MVDLAGKAHFWPLRGKPNWLVQGITGGALEFDGADDKIDVPCSAALNSPRFTVAFWAKVSGGVDTFRSPLTSRGDTPQRGYCFYADDKNRWSFWTGNGTRWHELHGTRVVIGEWHHIAGTYDGTTKRIYVDGAPIASGVVTIALNTTNPLRIGAGATEGNGNYYFPGALDDVRVYGRALSVQEIKSISEKSREG